MKLIFYMKLGIQKNDKFIQSFQVGLIKHAQSDSKQRISDISRMN